jgi:4'-phosphopantetheinyl transferase
MGMPCLEMAEAAASTNRTETRQTIEVCSLSLLASKQHAEHLSRYLSLCELERAGRFHLKADHDRYVAARSVLRLQLGAFLNCDPMTLLFEYTSYGKPLVANSGIEFNLSHSGDWVLFAFTLSCHAEMKLGVDIEQMRTFPDMRDVARVNFSAAEFARWDAAPESDRTAAFYRCWTRKESFIKAIGEGLSCPLDSFEVQFDLRQPAGLLSVNRDDAAAEQWWMADLPGFADYAAAVTARRTNWSEVSFAVREIDTAELLGLMRDAERFV